MKGNLIIAIAFLSGCAHNFYIADASGVSRGSIGVFDAWSETVPRDQMSSCIAGVGNLGGEERMLCANKVRSDMARRQRRQDWYAYPGYYGYGP